MLISQRGDGTAVLVSTSTNVDSIKVNSDGTVTFGKGLTLTTGSLTLTAGGVTISTIGQGLTVKSGSNAKIGTTAAMVAGVIATSTTAITANSVVLFSRKTTGGTPGHVSYTISAGVSFTLTSTSNTETSTFDYLIVEKG